MTTFQLRYWFESNSRDRTGEHVIETILAVSATAAAEVARGNMEHPTFVVTPSFGPANEGGLVVIQTALVRYVEVVPMAPAVAAEATY